MGNYKLVKEKNIVPKSNCYINKIGAQYISDNNDSYTSMNGFDGTIKKCTEKCDSINNCVGFNMKRGKNNLRCFFVKKKIYRIRLWFTK